LKTSLFSRLKTDSDGDAVTSDGRLFRTQAAATPKARSPTVTRRVGGMFSSSVEAERSRRREFMSATRRSSRAKYGGAISCKQRKASTASLNSIRCGTRNQRRSWSSGVMWSHFRAEHSSRAGCSSIHQTQTAVCRVGCLLRRQPSHCRNRGVSLQYEGHCQRL